MLKTNLGQRNTWHWVTRKDQKRISCMICEGAGLPRPAEVCEHDEWNTGNTLGISFWYYCLEHGIERGFSHHQTTHNKLALTVFILLTSSLMLTSPALAAPPPDAQLQSLLALASSAWGRSPDGPVSISSVPMNACDLSGGNISPNISVMEWTESLIDGVSAGRSYSIRLNSNCDWSRLPLAAAVLHEYGHALIGAGYHSRDKHSVMYPVLRQGQRLNIQVSDRKQLQINKWLP